MVAVLSRLLLRVARAHRGLVPVKAVEGACALVSSSCAATL